MEDLGTKIIQITSMSPIFKGLLTLIVGMLALLFVWYMKKRKNEPDSIGFRIYTALAIFIVLYGLFILLVQPEWWLPPYPLN